MVVYPIFARWKLIQYARNDEEREKLISKHHEVLNKLLDADDELNDLLHDTDDEAPTVAAPSPTAVTFEVTDVALEKNAQ
jgi:hypothetical protein